MKFGFGKKKKREKRESERAGRIEKKRGIGEGEGFTREGERNKGDWGRVAPTRKINFFFNKNRQIF